MGLFIIAVAAISLPFAITRNIQIIGKHAVLKETLEATDRKNYYLISSDVLRLNYTIHESSGLGYGMIRT